MRVWVGSRSPGDIESGDGGKEAGDAKVEPVDSDEPKARARHHAHRVGIHRRDGAAEAQGDVEKSEAKPEQEIGRADDAQVEAAETGDLGIVTEQANPHAGLEGDDQADRRRGTRGPPR